MKKSISATAILIIVSSSTYAQLSGPLSGVITSGNYTVKGEISLGAGDSLTIEPGTVFNFTGDYSFDIDGYLYAVGTETDSIKFRPIHPDSSWGGLDFNNSADDSSRLDYCVITGSNDNGISCVSSCPYILSSSISGNSTAYSGGGIIMYDSNPTIEYCSIFENHAVNQGGGILCNDSSPRIGNCYIIDNSADWGGGIRSNDSFAIINNCFIGNNVALEGGGGLFFDNSSDTVINCTISGNAALGLTFGGGGIYCWYSNLIIENSVIITNLGDWGGGFFCFLSNPNISNCVISNNIANYRGGGIYHYGSYTTIVNSIFDSNTGDGAIIFQANSTGSVTYSNFFNNDGFAFGGDNIPEGLGIITSINNNGDSCDVFSNIFIDPLFYATAGDSAYYLTANSPCIDAGDPSSPLDPDSTRADMGAHYFHQNVSVDENTFSLEPFTFNLSSPYPNPFNQTTAISFEMRDASFVNLTIYDITGREVQSLVNGHLSLGEHTVTFNSKGLSSGLYFVRLEAGGLKDVKKMVLVK